jgi:hypothetical protein
VQRHLLPYRILSKPLLPPLLLPPLLPPRL